MSISLTQTSHLARRTMVILTLSTLCLGQVWAVGGQRVVQKSKRTETRPGAKRSDPIARRQPKRLTVFLAKFENNAHQIREANASVSTSSRLLEKQKEKLDKLTFGETLKTAERQQLASAIKKDVAQTITSLEHAAERINELSGEQSKFNLDEFIPLATAVTKLNIDTDDDIDEFLSPAYVLRKIGVEQIELMNSHLSLFEYTQKKALNVVDIAIQNSDTSITNLPAKL